MHLWSQEYDTRFLAAVTGVTERMAQRLRTGGLVVDITSAPTFVCVTVHSTLDGSRAGLMNQGEA